MRALRDVTAPKVEQRSPVNGEESAYIDISSIDTERKRIVEPKRLQASDAPSRAKQLLRKGDVLVSMTRPNRNAVAIVQPELDGAIGSTGFHVLRAGDEVDPRWLFNAVQTKSFIAAMEELVQGALYPAVRPKDIQSYEISVPSLAEQRIAVAEIEKQFSRLDEAVANLKRVKANLKRYKAAVLKAAVEGRLVTTEAELARREGRTYETGIELLQRVLDVRRMTWTRTGAYKSPAVATASELPALPEGWAWATYDQVGNLQLGRQRAPRYHSGPNMRKYLRVQNVFEDRLDLSDVKEMDFPPADFAKYQLAPGDLLLNEGQSPELLGRPAIYRGELPGACFTNTLIRFRALDGVSVEFALHLTRYHMYAGRFVDEGTITTNIAHLSLGRLATVEFPLPPSAEQQRIVAEIERCLSLARGVEVQVDANLKRAERMRQAVLQTAFAASPVARQ